ncbi:MAG: M48 family metalloprotease [Rubripirellula sp.]
MRLDITLRLGSATQTGTVQVHLYFFLVVIVSLSCGSLPPADVSPTRALIATAGMLAAWILLCHVGARMCAVQVRKENLDPMVGANLLERQLSAFRWLGLGVVVLCLAGFGLARTLDSIPVLQDSIFLQAIILLTPAVAITAGTWSAEHRYGVLLGYTERGIGNHLKSVWQLFRGGIAWLIGPVLILLALSDLITLLPISEAWAGGLTAAMILLFVPLGLPWLIRHLFKTSPMSEPTEAWVCELMSAAGLRRTRAVRWNTGGRSFNAMVAGFIPPLRTLLISDRLIDELPREQMAMVVLHEAAHLRRRHVPLRMITIIPAWGAGALVTRIAGEQTWAVAAGSVVGILLTMLILRIVAYRTEYDADVQACKLAVEMNGRVNCVPSTYEHASDVLSAALLRVTFDHPGARKATWLHPGVADRVDWMRRQREVPIASKTTAGTIANPA